MHGFFGFATLLLLVSMVIFRVYTLKKQDIRALEFGSKDPKDFFILPFAAFYFYLIVANSFGLPTVPNQLIFATDAVSWLGVVVCLSALAFFIWAMISFRKSFRVGLVDNRKEGLVTNGAFSLSRNPIYVAFILMLIGQFLIFPSWILLIYIILAIFRFHRQVLKEEKFLAGQYGHVYHQYTRKVRRYL